MSSKLQPAIARLIKLHEDPDELEKMREFVQDQTVSTSQGHVAQVVRYLIKIRNEEEHE